MDCSLPGSSVHGITGVSCHFLLQGIFMTQGLNLSLLHCRQILYQLSHQGQKYWGCDKLGNIQVGSFSLKTTYSSHFSSSFHSLAFSLSFSLWVSLFLSLPYPTPLSLTHTHWLHSVRPSMSYCRYSGQTLEKGHLLVLNVHPLRH